MFVLLGHAFEDRTVLGAFADLGEAIDVATDCFGEGKYDCITIHECNGCNVRVVWEGLEDQGDDYTDDVYSDFPVARIKVS